MSIDHVLHPSEANEGDQHKIGQILPEVSEETFNNLIPDSVRTTADYPQELPVELRPIEISTEPETVEKHPRFSKAQKIWGTVALAGTTIAGIGFAAHESSNQAKPAPNTTITEAANPVETQPAAVVESPATSPTNIPEQSPAAVESTVVDPTVWHSNIVELGTFSTLSPEKQQQIRDMEAMSVDEFRALPDEEQLLFAQLVYDNNLTIAKYRLDKTGQNYVYEMVANATPGTPEAILANAMLTTAVVSSLKTMNDGAIAFDAATARKCAVLFTSNKDERGLNRTVGAGGIDDMIGTWNLNTPIVVPKLEIVASRVVEDKTVINIHDKELDTVVQGTYMSTEFTAADGTKRTITRQIYGVDANSPLAVQNMGK